uniref:Uncharacterized protein n=1 Tax=Thermofilum pendens TaxID=2269 RepID=A0A7J3X4R3_THEPE
MRTVEAAAIALVYVIAVGMLVSTAARQAVAVHHVSVEQAVAYALLRCQNLTCLLDAVGGAVDSVAALYVNGTAVAFAPRTCVCYAALVLDPSGGSTRVRVCASP